MAATRDALVARARAWSGLVLMAYAFCHLVNHAMGLISLAAMEWFRQNVNGLWHSEPGKLVILVALSAHVLVALWLVASRPLRRLGGWQWAQLALGFLVPLVLAQHVAGTAMIEGATDAQASYASVLVAIWPTSALAYVALIVAVWAHGCLGLHYWWRLNPSYQRAQPWLLAVAILVPALAIGGLVSGGRDTAERARTEAARWAAQDHWGKPEATAACVAKAQTAVFVVVYGGLALALGWQALTVLRRRRLEIAVTYPGGHVVRAAAGRTLLEISRAAGIPHAAICGGRARCSTCRVRIGEGARDLPPPAGDEARLLARLGHPADVRLACQIRPTAALTVIPLVAPAGALADARSDADPGLGREREVAVLFVDLRGFTQLSEQRLPYDVVYLLNQYFRSMGEAVEAAGGHVDKFVGDGLMALFGLRSPPELAARQALDAAARMADALERLNESLAGELEQPLRVAMGLHQGPAIVGEMGHGRSRQLTAIGDTVNTASRLEALAKAENVQLVVSDAVLDRAGRSGGDPTFVELRGRAAALAVHVTADARALPSASVDLNGRVTVQ